MTTVTIIGLIVISAIFIFYLSNKGSKGQSDKPVQPTLTIDHTTPDSPVSFGYKCLWFAVKTDNKNRIAEILNLENITDCNWQIGIDKAYNNSIYITPTLDGWTLACGWGLPTGDTEKSIDTVKTILEILSKEFGEAQFFCTHRVTEYHCWIKATNGHILRVYSFIGEAGENLVVEGQPTEVEKPIKLINTLSNEARNKNYFERKDIVWPDEELVMKVAANWSINPTTLDDRKEISSTLGLLGIR